MSARDGTDEPKEKREREPARGGSDRLPVDATSSPAPEQVLNALPVAIFIADASGNVTYTNRAAQNLLGDQARSATKHEDLARAYEAYVAGKGTLYPVERMPLYRALHGEVSKIDDMVLKTPHGLTNLEVTGVPLADRDGNVLFGMAVFQDITARKQTEEALRESEERYALAARGANDGLWDWDLRADRVYFSPRWKSMLGHDDDEIGTHIDEWFSRIHPEDAALVRYQVRQHMDGFTDQFVCEHRIQHKDGSYLWVLSRACAVRDSQGHTSRMAGSQTDITRRTVYDALTGLPNRTLFMDRMSRALERAGRVPGFVCAVLFIDLDRFAVVGQSLGHAAGDELLFAVARRLEALIRPQHTVARLSGDDFAVLLEDILDVSEAEAIAEELQRKIKAAFHVAGHEVFATASIGIACSASGYEHPEDLLRDASTAMHRAKALGKARYEVFDAPMRDTAVARLRLESELRRAVERHDFTVLYQPIVSLSTGKIHGFEALLRRQHIDPNLRSPTTFIPTAEETGLIVPIGEWVLSHACGQMREWGKRFAGRAPLTMSVNVSAEQFGNAELVNHVRAALGESGIPAAQLKLEVTESVIMKPSDVTARTLAQLKDMGVGLHMDDFGTGYSSISYLHRFPMDAVKIDRSFVSAMGTGPGNAEIVGTIIGLARILGMSVIAEGVETSLQLDRLRALRCDFVQGYLFSEPVDAKTATALLERDRSWI